MDFPINPFAFPDDQLLLAFGITSVVLGFAAVAALEFAFPLKRAKAFQGDRLTVNFGLGLINMTISALLPLSALAAAGIAAAWDWGLFQWYPAPWWVTIPTLLVAKSLLDYGLHWLFHRIDVLWAMHAVHHRDDAMDLATSFRVHPLSHVIIMVPNALLVLALGPDIWAAVIVEAMLFVASLFQHANLRLPEALSVRLERWLVTPRMHLVHHARDRAMHDSNYGLLFSFWDHLFGTYRAPPAEEFAIGVTDTGVNDQLKS